MSRHEHLKVRVCGNTINCITVQAALSCCVWCIATKANTLLHMQLIPMKWADSILSWCYKMSAILGWKNTGFEDNISEGDRICMPCYKSHLQILRGAPVSTDRDILVRLKSWVQLISMVKTTDGVISIEQLTAQQYMYRGEATPAKMLCSVHMIFCTQTSEVSTAANLE